MPEDVMVCLRFEWDARGVMKRTEKETTRNRLPDPPKRRPPGIGFQASPPDFPEKAPPEE